MEETSGKDNNPAIALRFSDISSRAEMRTLIGEAAWQANKRTSILLAPRRRIREGS